MREATAAGTCKALMAGSPSSVKKPKRRVLRMPKGAAGMLLPVALFAVGIGACLSCGVSVSESMRGFSYSTLALIVSMEIFTNLMARTGFMEWAAVRLAIVSGGRQKTLLAVLAGFMFIVSSTMNNITAVLCILPCIFVLFRAIIPDEKYLATFFAVLLATSNLGGAASAVGDLPAILIMNTGVVSFADYTARACPFFAGTTAVLVALWTLSLRLRGVEENLEDTSLAIGVLSAQYRYVKVDTKTLVPLASVLAGMICCWIIIPQDVMGPETIAVVGCLVAIALFRIFGGEPERAVNMGSVLTIASFLFMAAAISSTGVLLDIAGILREIAPDDKSYLILVLVLASAISGLVGAGPAAAVCLPIITQLATTVFAASCPTVMVAYGAAICAGSSLFMWSATAGFILSGKVGEACLPDASRSTYSWSIADYLPFGIANYAIQMSATLVLATIAL